MGNQYWKNAISGRYKVHCTNKIFYTLEIYGTSLGVKANNENPQLYFVYNEGACYGYWLPSKIIIRFYIWI